MRLAIAGFNLESVTFLPNPTTLNDFEVLAKRGQDLLDSFLGTNTVPGGFIAECTAQKVEMLPLVYSEAGAAASAASPPGAVAGQPARALGAARHRGGPHPRQSGRVHAVHGRRPHQRQRADFQGVVGGDWRQDVLRVHVRHATNRD